MVVSLTALFLVDTTDPPPTVENSADYASFGYSTMVLLQWKQFMMGLVVFFICLKFLKLCDNVPYINGTCSALCISRSVAHAMGAFYSDREYVRCQCRATNTILHRVHGADGRVYLAVSDR